MTTRDRLCLLILLLAITGCSSTFEVLSTPAQADVSYMDPKTQEKKSLGQTPLSIPMSQIEDALGEKGAEGASFISIVVEKAGHQTQSIAIPRSSFGTMVMSLDVKLKEGDDKIQVGKADDILKRFFLAQRFTNNKEYQRALSEIDRIIEIAPGFARAYSMKGSIYFVQKNFAESLKWYEQAVKLDPQMEEAVKMIARVNTLMGRRNVAGGGRQ
jgi:tetratricopeptide (TPR) repeat protein